MRKNTFPTSTIVCLTASFLYLGYASIGLFQDHYIGEHFDRTEHLQFRLQMFSAIIPLAVQVFQYRALRSYKVYFTWLLFSLILIGFEIAFYKDKSLIVRDDWSAMTGFKSLFLFLLWFQGCRRLNKYFSNAELILPASDISQPKVNGLPYDYHDKQFLTVLDYIALFGAWILIIVSTMN